MHFPDLINTKFETKNTCSLPFMVANYDRRGKRTGRKTGEMLFTGCMGNAVGGCNS